MISLHKTGRNEALLRMDLEGARQLLAALSSLRDNAEQPRLLTANIDTTLLGRRTHDLRPYPLRVAKQQPGTPDGSLAFKGTDVVWRFVEAEDEIEYTITRLEDAVELGAFEPAELLMLEIPKAEHLVQIYAEIA